jgi:hypothetical protein
LGGLASAAVTLVTFVTGILYFTVDQPYGTIQDAASALQVLLMLPTTWMLHRLLATLITSVKGLKWQPDCDFFRIQGADLVV